MRDAGLEASNVRVLTKQVKKMSKIIHVRVPENALQELKDLKGDDTWAALFLDGAKYRGNILRARRRKNEFLLEDKEALNFNDFIRCALADHPNLLSIFHKLGGSACSLEIYEYLLWAEKPMTVDDIIHSGVSSSRDSVFRVIKKLREMGLIACVGFKRVHYTKRSGGPRPLLWVAV